MTDDVKHEGEGELEPSVGERLRAAREARGVSLQDIANQTRIPVRHLQHVEQEEWDDLPGVTYCVGFTRSYANAVGLDGAELGREVREALGGPRNRTPAVNYYEPADPARKPPLSLIVGAVLLIALVIAYVLWRSTLSDEPAAEAPPATPPSAASAPSAPAPPPPVRAGQTVTLVATGEVWLRIVDGQGGASVFQGVLAQGQTFDIPAAAQRPLLRTGRPQLLRVTVGGRDLGPLEPAERTVSDVSLRAEDLANRVQTATPPPAQ